MFAMGGQHAPNGAARKQAVYAAPMRHARVAACLVAQLAALPLARKAAAQSGPPITADSFAASSPDIVYLTGGGVLRGTVIDVVPGIGVRVRLANAEAGAEAKVVTIPQREVLNWIRPGAPPVEGPVVPPARWADLKPDEPATLVHLDGWLARLQLDSTGRGQWTDVCSSPCDMNVPANASYRVVGDALKPSGRFALRAGPGERGTLFVHGASRPEFTIGIVSIAVGTPVSLFAALTVGLSQTLSGPSGTSSTILDATLVGGAVFAVTGMVLMLANWTTSVGQDPTVTSTVPPPRAPPWFSAMPTPTLTERAVNVPAIGLPVLGGRF